MLMAYINGDNCFKKDNHGAHVVLGCFPCLSPYLNTVKHLWDHPATRSQPITHNWTVLSKELMSDSCYHLSKSRGVDAEKNYRNIEGDPTKY